MAEKGNGPDRPLASALAPGLPADMMELSRKRLEEGLDLQKEVLSVYEQVNRAVLDRARLETQLAIELTTRLATAKSAPEAAQAYQDWLGRHMQLFVEDGQRLAADAERLVGMSTRLLTNRFGVAGK